MASDTSGHKCGRKKTRRGKLAVAATSRGQLFNMPQPAFFTYSEDEIEDGGQSSMLGQTNATAAPKPARIPIPATKSADC